MGLFSQNSGRITEGWVFDAKAPLVAGCAVADRNGQPHVIVGTTKGTIICLDQQGHEVWTYHAEEQFTEVESFFVDEERVHGIDAPPLVADINNDGKHEILFGTEAGILYCVSMDGKLIWKEDCKGTIRASPEVADINSDGHPEILVGAGNKLVVVQYTGHTLFEYIGDAPVESVPCVVKAGKTIIVFGNNNGQLTAITPSQELVWQRELRDKITAAPVAFKANEEQRVIVGTLGGIVVCVSEHGEPVWDFKTEGSVYSKVAIGDINDDKQSEVVISSCDNNVYALTLDGERVWSYQTDFWITSTPIIADLDNDHHLEVVVGSYDHNIYVLDGQGTYVLDYVPGLSGIVHQAGHYASTLTSDPGEQTGKRLYKYRVENMVVGCSLLENHGKPTLVVSTKEGHVHTLTHEQQ
ncbi:MAG: PQQ-binding-like beta-propeller repeat protein [Candidatus Woesearchaeota archaeon]|nr:PQQ-binding-like beta-propeller repeat protein [Candidatus Woesearchaeota archaeon]